ncbi:hypothetical protein LCGC14_1298190 [marine sediment metagenome]|uniref:HNH nuclease domain-containing protein n=1 Tax=marine sediment metagenome TaxID=412755 RepID=A0A0F9KS03_9ZZZZ
MVSKYSKAIHIDPEYISSVLDYCPDTGDFSWKERPLSMFESERMFSEWNKRYSGKKAGAVAKSHRTSYVQIKVNGKLYLAHRLAWVITYGSQPDQIDHIDGDGLNNRIENIRNVSGSENAKNCRMRKDNSSGYSGVAWNKKSKKWQASSSVDRKIRHLGEFHSIDDAVVAVKEFRKANGFTDRHGVEDI